MLSLFLSVRLPEEAGRWINKLLRKSPHVKVLMDEEGHPRFFFFHFDELFSIRSKQGHSPAACRTWPGGGSPLPRGKEASTALRTVLIQALTSDLLRAREGLAAYHVFLVTPWL